MECEERQPFFDNHTHQVKTRTNSVHRERLEERPKKCATKKGVFKMNLSLSCLGNLKLKEKVNVKNYQTRRQSTKKAGKEGLVRQPQDTAGIWVCGFAGIRVQSYMMSPSVRRSILHTSEKTILTLKDFAPKHTCRRYVGTRYLTNGARF